MNAKRTLNVIRDFCGMEIKLESAKLADGTTVIEYDSLEPKSSISVINSEGMPIAMPVGDYVLEDGTTIVVVNEGEIDTVKPKEEKPMENPAATPEAKAPEMGAEQMPKKLIESSIREVLFSDEFMTHLKSALKDEAKPEPEKTELKKDDEKEDDKGPDPIVTNPEAGKVNLAMGKVDSNDKVSQFLQRVY